jgi:hypothetical protein
MVTDPVGKSIRLVTSRPVKEYNVDIFPGETFTEVLRKAGLDVNDYISLKPTDQTEFLPGEDVYPYVGENSKLHLTMRSDVGATLTDSIMGWIRSTPSIQRFLRNLLSDPNYGLEGRPTDSDYARDNGWKMQRVAAGILYRGFYHAARQRWEGAVIQKGNKFDFKILKPPIGVIRGTEWEGCFHSVSPDGWYHISFKPNHLPKDASSGIVAINKILQLCFQRAVSRRRR